jgi:cysteinyl-tRNA synthetase
MEYFYETLRRVDARLGAKLPAPGPLHEDPARFRREFEAAMDDDFNSPGGLGALSGLFAAMNELLDKPPVQDKAQVMRTLHALREDVRALSGALGLFEDAPDAWLLRRRDRAVAERGIDVAQVQALLDARTEARKSKDFARADALRGELGALGVEIMDTAAGTSWKVTPAVSPADA